IPHTHGRDRLFLEQGNLGNPSLPLARSRHAAPDARQARRSRRPSAARRAGGRPAPRLRRSPAPQADRKGVQAMNDELIRNSNEPGRWTACAEELNNVLRAIDTDAARRKASGTVTDKDAETERNKAMDETRKTFASVQYQQWPFNRMHYTLGQ